LRSQRQTVRISDFRSSPLPLTQAPGVYPNGWIFRVPQLSVDFTRTDAPGAISILKTPG